MDIFRILCTFHSSVLGEFQFPKKVLIGNFKVSLMACNLFLDLAVSMVPFFILVRPAPIFILDPTSSMLLILGPRSDQFHFISEIWSVPFLVIDPFLSIPYPRFSPFHSVSKIRSVTLLIRDPTSYILYPGSDQFHCLSKIYPVPFPIPNYNQGYIELRIGGKSLLTF